MLRKCLLFVLSIFAAMHVLAAEDFERYSLTVPMLEKYVAVMADAEKLSSAKGTGKGKGLDELGDSEDKSTDDMVRRIDSIPELRPILARHGFTSRTFALTTQAYFVAALYLGFEPSLAKKDAAEVLEGYTKKTRSNIELLRRNPKFMEKK